MNDRRPEWEKMETSVIFNRWFLVALVPLVLGLNSWNDPNSSFSLQDCRSCSSRNILYVSAYCSGERFNTSRLLPSIQTAVGLSEVQFNLTQCAEADVMDGIDTLLRGLIEFPPELAVLHPGCFNNTKVLADISKFFNSNLVSFAFSVIPSLPHGNHVWMLPSETHLGYGVAALLKYFGWKRLLVFSEDYPIFHSIRSSLDSKLKEVDMSINVTQTLLVHDRNNGISFPRDNRIILINTFPSEARMILCKAWTKQMLFPSFVWITYEWDEVEWWKASKGHSTANNDCSDDQIKNILKGSLVVSHHPMVEEDSDDNLFNSTSKYERYANDAISVLAAVINRSKTDQNTSFIELVNTISFSGASGSVSFKDGIRQLDAVTIKQYKTRIDGQLELVTIGQIHLTGRDEGKFMYMTGRNNPSTWGGDPPRDGSPEFRVNTPLLPLMLVAYIFASSGIVFALVCLLFNIIFRKRKLIQLTSPKLNYIIITGTIVLFCSTYTFFHLPNISDKLFSIICNLRLCILSIGFTLCYGPINAKMCRVYHICRKPNPSMKKLFVKDWHLTLIVAGFLAADIIMLIVVLTLDSVRYSFQVIPDKEHPGRHTETGTGITVTYNIRRCYSSDEIIFLPILIGYKLIIQAIGVYLAFSIRNVKIKGLNDSKQISAILYITTTITFIVIISNFLFGDYINIDGAVYSIGVSTASTFVLGFIFIPKMVGLYKDPDGKNMFGTSNNGLAMSLDGAIVDDKRIKLIINSYKKRIQLLEHQLKEQNAK